MKFKKYKSIINIEKDDITYLQKVLKDANMEDTKFFVSEKIHGGNIGIYYEQNGNIKISTRNQFTEEPHIKDTVYKYDINNILEYLYTYIKENIDSDIESIILYCEIYGGSYPHPDVRKDKNSKRIQKGVYYSPTNELYPFDIFIPKGYNEDDKVIGYYLDGDDFINLMNSLNSDLPNYTYNLFTGNLKECLDYNPEFVTNIPKLFNLPPIDDNISEGIVIKPLRGNEMIKKLNDKGISMENMYIKKKYEKFNEKARKSKKDKTSYKQKYKKVQSILPDVDDYITENRINNIKSHYDNLKGNNKSNFMREFVDDVLNDCVSDKIFIEHELEKQELKIIKKYITNQLFKKYANLVLEDYN